MGNEPATPFEAVLGPRGEVVAVAMGPELVDARTSRATALAATHTQWSAKNEVTRWSALKVFSFDWSHFPPTLVITAIVAAAALATIEFAVPQQVMAGGYGHHHNHHNRNNGLKVDQQINQENNCTHSICANDGQNNFGLPQPQVTWN